MMGGVLVRVSDIAELITKGTTPTSLNRPFTTTGIRFIKVESISKSGELLHAKCAYIDQETNEILARSQLHSGDILFSIAGALGRTTKVEDSWLPANTNQAFSIIRPAKSVRQISPGYLLWQLRSPEILKRIAEINVQAAQANLSLQQIRELEIPLFEMSQQNHICEILDYTENHISTLERLIVKKEAVKQGMMQQLLTGKTRLPGFTDPWTKVRLGSVLNVCHGKDQKSVEVNGGIYPILASGGEIGRTNTALFSRPSVLIGRKGTIDRPQFQEQPFWTVDTLFYTQIFNNADAKLLFYIFQTIDWYSLNESSGVPSLTASRIEKIPIRLPLLSEQISIRLTLDDFESEIQVLRRRLDKAKAIKQGMMQELLTGRTRLPVGPEATTAVGEPPISPDLSTPRALEES